MMESEVGRLADATVRLPVRLAETAVLLALAMSYTWADMMAALCQAAGRAVDDRARLQARTVRLVGRGMPSPRRAVA